MSEPHRWAAPRPAYKPAPPREAREDDRFEPIHPGRWQGKHPPRIEWMVDGLMTKSIVAMVSGDGKIGKSLLMQQLCTCAVLGRPFLGLRTTPGRALYFGCEDDEGVLWRRQADINKHLDVEMADVEDAGLHLYPRVGADNTLAFLDRATWRMKGTGLFARMGKYCYEHGISYVVIDTATQTFRGNQNDETQVKDYINMLRRLAVAIQGVVIFTKHPSLSGRALGTGESGNVAWTNSVRARVYVHRDKTEQLVFEPLTGNYTKTGDAIPIRWDSGVFVENRPEPAPRWGDI